MSRCPVCEPESYYGDKNGEWVEGSVCERCQGELSGVCKRIDTYCGQEFYSPLLVTAELQCADHEHMFGPMLLGTPYSVVKERRGYFLQRNPAIKVCNFKDFDGLYVEIPADVSQEVGDE